MGQIPYIVFLPCPTTIISCLDRNDQFNNSSQALLKELHTERFAVYVNKKFKGIGSHSLRDSFMFDKMNAQFEEILRQTKDITQAIKSVRSVGLVFSVFELSDRQEFKFTNLHMSVLELAKDLSQDNRDSKIIILCNCDEKKPTYEAKESLIKTLKEKTGKYLGEYDFEVLNTDELIADSEYFMLLTKH